MPDRGQKLLAFGIEDKSLADERCFGIPPCLISQLQRGLS